MSEKSGKAYYRSTHKIQDIDYRADWLLCICGWIGRAYDNNSGDDLDWPTHRRTAEPTDLTIEKKYKGSYGRVTVRPPKDKVEAEIF